MRKKDRIKPVFYYLIMKILNIINLIGILLNPIALDKYKTITNRTDDIYYNGCQCIYTYSIDEYGASANASYQGFVGVEANIPSTYRFDLTIQLNYPVKYAFIELMFTAMITGNYSFNYIVENGQVMSSGTRSLNIKAQNTDHVNIILLFTREQLNDCYGYGSTWSNPYTNIEQWTTEWVEHGINYFDVMTAELTSVDRDYGEYSDTLDDILNSVDSVETILNNLVTNTDRLSTISTNIQSIKNTLDNILLAMNNIDNQIDTISWNNYTLTYNGYKSDWANPNSVPDTDGGYHNAGFYLISGINFTQSTLGSVFKFTIPLGAFSSVLDSNKELKLSFFQITDSTTRRTFTLDEYIVFQDRYKITIYFTLDSDSIFYPFGNYQIGIQVPERCYYYTTIPWKLEYMGKDDIEYWTIYNAIKNEDKLYNTLEDIAIMLHKQFDNDVDNDIYQTDQSYNQLLQMLQFKNIPAMNDPKIMLLLNFIDYYSQIINFQQLSLLKWVLGVSSVMALFKVVTR